MLISTSIFLFLDSSKVALDDSEYKITKAWVLWLGLGLPATLLFLLPFLIGSFLEMEVHCVDHIREIHSY